MAARRAGRQKFRTHSSSALIANSRRQSVEAAPELLLINVRRRRLLLAEQPQHLHQRLVALHHTQQRPCRRARVDEVEAGDVGDVFAQRVVQFQSPFATTTIDEASREQFHERSDLREWLKKGNANETGSDYGVGPDATWYDFSITWPLLNTTVGWSVTL
jgi:flagellar biogenesis protein FliO